MNLNAHERTSKAGIDRFPGPRVAFVDRDEVYRTALAACLRAEGFHVDEYKNSRSVLDALDDGEELDAILIDAGSSADDRGHLFGQLQRLNGGIPVAVISRAVDGQIEEAALRHGAADFLLKSRGPTIVARRLRLLVSGIRGAREPWVQNDEEVTHIGLLTLRLESHRALWSGSQVPLTVTEFRIVRLLACGQGKVFTYREIYDVVHGAGFVAGDGLDGYRINVRALIKKIRKRFRAIDPAFDEIENAPGRGYRWRHQRQSDAASLTAGRTAGDRSPDHRLVA